MRSLFQGTGATGEIDKADGEVDLLRRMSVVKANITDGWSSEVIWVKLKNKNRDDHFVGSVLQAPN